jgi:hypothetical protein
MSNSRLQKAMIRYFELCGAVTEDNIAQQVAYAAREIERGELPDQVVAMFRRANELRVWHKGLGTGAPGAEGGPPPDEPRAGRLVEPEALIPELSPETSNVHAEMIALINVAQQALDSLLVERMELVRLQRSTHHVDTTIRAARHQLGELHRAALEHYKPPSKVLSSGDEPGHDCIEPGTTLLPR